MKLATFEHDGELRVGEVRDGRIVEFDVPSMRAVLRARRFGIAIGP